MGIISDKKTEIISIVMICTGIIAALLVINFKNTKDLRITCLDVGQGDSSVLQTAEGWNFLIDCGSSSEKNTGKYDLIPFLKHQGISRIDGIFITHTDEDHVNGIMELLTEITERLTAIRVRRIILPDWTEKGDLFQKIEELALTAGIEIVYANAGDLLEAGEMKIKILHPPRHSSGIDTNNEGLVLQIDFRDFCGLFMGDVGEEVEKSLLPVLKDVDFLKAGHHGSKYSTGMTFLELISPEVAVISCAKNNSYGHPAPETVERLEKIGCQVEYTMKNGAITISLDDKDIRVDRYVQE